MAWFRAEVIGNTLPRERSTLTVVAALAPLAVQPPATSKTAVERVIVGVVKEVAADLGNTRAVCRTSSIHPRVPEAYTDNALPARARTCAGLSADESRALQLLSKERAI